jgi:anti-anti-sigma factor
MSEEFSLKSHIDRDALVIQTHGYINSDGGEKIAEECYKHIDRGTRNIVLDVEESQVVNSIGISIILEILEKVDQVGGRLTFTNMSSAIEKTLTIMGIFKYASKAATVEAAVTQTK